MNDGPATSAKHGAGVNAAVALAQQRGRLFRREVLAVQQNQRPDGKRKQEATVELGGTCNALRQCSPGAPAVASTSGRQRKPYRASLLCP